MPARSEEDKPCLIETRQGLSVLYKNRYLYSKYNPAAGIERLVDSLEIREATLVLCFSPVLGYGLQQLAAKMPQHAFMLVVEVDPKLMEFYDTTVIPAQAGFFSARQLEDLYKILTRKNQVAENGVRIPPPGSFKYCLRVDFSGSPALHQAEYQAIHQTAELAVANFWKNRLTLIKMGRLYHRNMLRNLALLPWGKDIPAAKVDRPILVLGAGPSADDTIQQLASLSLDQRKNLCLLAVDAAVPALLARKIKPDLVLALECQHAIQQAYTSAREQQLFLLADLTSRPSILHEDTGFRAAAGNNDGAEGTKEASGQNCTGGTTAFFSTEFAPTTFLERLHRLGLVNHLLPPLGSVGLAALEMAIMLRKSREIPVFVSGLDFSYGLGRTHCKESFQARGNLMRCSRLSPPGSYESLSNPTTEKREGKTGAVYSDQILTHYAQIFMNRFQGAANVFDLGDSGLDLGLQRLDFATAWEKLVPHKEQNQQVSLGCYTAAPLQLATEDKRNRRKQVEEFYCQEEAMLKELRDGLSQGTISKERIRVILEEADYLYLHFPDGYKPSLDTSFLKRVRSEIDFFLKDIAIGKRIVARK